MAVGIRHADQNLTLTSSTSDGHSVGIGRSRTQATEFVSLLLENEAFVVSDEF
jgi:hypothetical protein